MGQTLTIADFEEVAPVKFALKSPLTDAEFVALRERYDGYRVEVSAEGEVTLLPMPYTKTNLQNTEIVFQLKLWNKQGRGGVVLGPDGDIILPNGARRAPDAAWMSKERVAALPQWQRDTFYRIAPEFVIELRSETDRLKAVRAKMTEYMETGSQLGWLIDPEEKTVWIYRPDREPERLDNPSRIVGEGPVEGFVLDLTEVWS
ncbi:MAG: Uma2 family endonuclease [Bryobacteraceae bacterium]|nr:Uma2 family endonuclease [Bryobacteraceae bacterium]